MYDNKIILEVLKQIESAADKIVKNFQTIKNISDFTDNSDGTEKINAVCMRLIVIGESLNKFDNITKGTLLPLYPEVNWNRAKGMRDILTHHHNDVDAEAIFLICRDDIPLLLKSVKKIIKDHS